MHSDGVVTTRNTGIQASGEELAGADEGSRQQLQAVSIWQEETAAANVCTYWSIIGKHSHLNQYQGGFAIVPWV